MRKHNGTLVFLINGREMGVAASDIPQTVYGVVDLYGQCSGVKISSDNQSATCDGEIAGISSNQHTENVSRT